MKKLFLFIAFAFVLITETFAQTPISALPTITTDVTGGWVPVVVGTTTRKTDAKNLGNLDSLSIASGTTFDTLKVFKNGVQKYYKLIRAGGGGSYTFQNGITESGGTVKADTSLLATQFKLDTTRNGIRADLNGKQSTLVSGTSIKTINGNSLLGSGDLTISGAVATVVPFNNSISFDEPYKYSYKSLDANVVFVPDTVNKIIGATNILRLELNGTNTVNFGGGFKKLASSDNIVNDTGRVYLIAFLVDSLNSYYTVTFSHTIDVTAPTIVSRTIENADRNTIILTADEVLDESSVPATTDFSVSGGKSVTSINVSSNTVLVNVNSDYANGDIITISYTGGTNKLKDLSGNLVANFTNASVTNNISAFTDLAITGTYIESPSATIYQVVSGSPNSGYGNIGVGDKYLPSSTDGRIVFKMETTAGTSRHIMGFNSTSTPITSFTDLEVGFWIEGGGIYKRDGGSIVNLGTGDISVGSWYCIYRTGSTFKLQKSTDLNTWTDIHTFTYTSSGAMYPMFDFNKPDSPLYYPKSSGLIL